MNHMIHNLTPTPTQVYITYDLDFIPAGTPAAAGIRDVHTLWMRRRRASRSTRSSTSTRARAAATAASPTRDESRGAARGYARNR